MLRRRKKELSSTEKALAKLPIFPWERVGPSIFLVIWILAIGLLLTR